MSQPHLIHLLHRLLADALFGEEASALDFFLFVSLLCGFFFEKGES